MLKQEIEKELFKFRLSSVVKVPMLLNKSNEVNVSK